MIIKKARWPAAAILILLLTALFLPKNFSVKIKSFFLNPLEYSLSSANRQSRNLIGFISYKELIRENKELKRQLGKLQAQIIQQEEILLEAGRLKELLGFKEKLDKEAVIAEVIGKDPQNLYGVLIINKGRADNITEGSVVLDEHGLVGRVIESYDSLSRVMLLTDSSSRIAARVQRTRDEGVLEGIRSNLCRMKYLNLESKILPGDKVITSGYSQIFPEGLLIGTVVEIMEDPTHLYKIALIEPESDLSRIEEVICIPGAKSPLY